MSARSLRRVLQEREEQQLRSSASDPDGAAAEDEDSESPVSVAPSRNPFDLLDDQDIDNEMDAAESDDKVVEEELAANKSSVVIPSSLPKSKKKKKSKQGKERSENSIDSILDDLSKITSSEHKSLLENPKSATISAEDKFKQQGTLFLLTVNPKYLKAENELRKIFGSKVVNSFENNHGAGGSRQMAGGRRASHNPRRTILISPPGYWPRWDGSFSMELLETKGGIHYFKYVHSQSYIHAQEAFEACKATHDLNAIADILAHHPFHIDALLTFAEVFKFSGEHQSSAEAIGTCLFALECAWHPLFNPLQGNCQLKYTHDTNKPLFSALFSHMKDMDRRGCHRSALEVCKLLLLLDSDDPLGALFCIDYFSLRAQEYRWLEQFAEEYRSDNSLWMFPNFSFSLAICRLYMERDSASKNDVKIEKATSVDLMKQALLLHPLVLKKLVAKAPLKDPAWTTILKNSFFGSSQAGSSSLDHLISIYIERSHIIWRFPELQNCLKEAALLVIESLKHNSTEAKDWACVRREAFPSEKNEYSHLLISEFSDAVPSIPPEELRQFMVGPHLMQNIQNVNRDADPQRAADVREVTGRNPAIVFLESLLPWVDYGTNASERQNGET